MNPLPPRRRRGRVHFDPTQARLYEMGMIQQGWETLEALSRFRCLTSWQVAKLLFLGQPNLAGKPRSDAAARKAANERCLRRLKDRQLIACHQVMLQANGTFRRQEYLVLTEAGHQLLRDWMVARGAQPPPWNPTRGQIAPEALLHQLMISDIGIALARSAEFHRWRLEAWLDDHELAGLQATKQISFPGFVPDACVALAHQDTRRLYLIEADRGTEPVASEAANSWRTKMRRYRRFLTGAWPADPFFAAQPRPLLLIVTTSPTRLEQLLAETAAVGPAARSFVTLAEWLEPPYDALHLIWRRPDGGDQFVSLLDEMALGPG